jgi:choline dehydrogenase-like flavoprotein
MTLRNFNDQIINFGSTKGQARVDDIADVVVVGSGAAGATSARVLSEAGLQVVLVEEGPYIAPEDVETEVYTSMKRAWRDVSMQVAKGPSYTPILQGRCVGGTTAINSAIIHRIPESIHQQWCDEQGVGDWLPYGELSRIWDQLDEELSVGTADEHVRGNNSRLLEEGLRRVGSGGNWIRRAVKDCEGSAHCAQACPTGRKQSMDNSFIPRALSDGARLYHDCRAEKFEIVGGRAVGVHARLIDPMTGEKGPKVFIRARHAVVLAASAIQSPVLLQRQGIGKRSGQVGRRFQAHPGTAVVGVFDDPVSMGFGATQGYETTRFWDERMKFESLSMPPELALARLPGIGARLMNRLSEYDNLAVWAVQVRAQSHGRVKRSLTGKPSIRYDFSQDVPLFKNGVHQLCEMMFAAGATALYPGVHGLPEKVYSMDEVAPIKDLPNDPSRYHCIASHLFGTAVMGVDPKKSVVSPWLETHDVQGLYVLDSSVFPTNMGVNPQHGISAMAWLASERIAEAALGASGIRTVDRDRAA